MVSDRLYRDPLFNAKLTEVIGERANRARRCLVMSMESRDLLLCNSYNPIPRDLAEI